MSLVLLAARLVLALVFLAAAVGKLLDLPGARRAVHAFGVPERYAGLIGASLPPVEMAVAIALIPSSSAPAAAVAAAVLLIMFAGGMALALARGEQPDCHCFGRLHSAPVSRLALVRNGVLAAVAVFIAVAGSPRDGGASAVNWIARLQTGAVIALVAGVLAGLAIAGLTAFCLALLRQHGRILERLELLEAGGDPHPVETSAPAGLPVGDPAPDFELDDLDGERVSLTALRERGLPVALVFADPGCGPCTALLPEVAAWQRDHDERLTVAVVSRATPEDHRASGAEHGLVTALRQHGEEVSRAYGTLRTPAAVLVSADGRVASAAAGGAEAVRALVAEAITQPVSLPPRAGDPAPAIELMDLDGHDHRLDDTQGQPTAVLFFDPGCGFCQRMLPDLRARLAQTPPARAALVLVSSGDAETNRALDLNARILLDPEHRAMRAYGARGTPVAVLLDGSGLIVSPEPAIGAPEVLALLEMEVGVA